MSTSARKRVAEHATILGLYFALACCATYPLIRAPHRYFPGLSWDNASNVWNIWWTKTALWEEGRLPFRNPPEFLPHSERLSILYTNQSKLYGLVYAAGAALYDNPVFWANVCLLLSFTFSAYGAFLWTRLLTNDRGAGFMAGVAFAFCSQQMSNMASTLDNLSCEWAPLYLYFLYRGLGEGRVRFALGAGAMAAATLWNSFYTLFFIVFLTGGFLALNPVLHCVKAPPGRSTIWFGLTLLFAAALSAPVLLAIRDAARSCDLPIYDTRAVYSYTLWSYLLPAGRHSLWGEWAEGLRRGLGVARQPAYFGYITMGLAVYGLRGSRTGWQRYCLAMAGLFLVLSLGETIQFRPDRAPWRYAWPAAPLLAAGGIIAWRRGRRGWAGTLWALFAGSLAVALAKPLGQDSLGPVSGIPLPYRILRGLPVVHDLRAPCRFASMVALCAAALAGFGWIRLGRRLATRPGVKAVILAALCGGMLLENLHAPLTSQQPPILDDSLQPGLVPLMLLQRIRDDKTNGSVFVFPSGSYHGWSAWLQILHHRPNVTGFHARLGSERGVYYDFLLNNAWFDPPIGPGEIKQVRETPDPAYVQLGRDMTRLSSDYWTRESVADFCQFFDLRDILIAPDKPGQGIGGRLRKDLFAIEEYDEEGSAALCILKKSPWRDPTIVDAGSLVQSFHFIKGISRLPGMNGRLLERPVGTMAFRLDAPQRVCLEATLEYYPVDEGEGAELAIDLNDHELARVLPRPGKNRFEMEAPAEVSRAGYNYIGIRARGGGEAAGVRPARPFDGAAILLKTFRIGAEPATHRETPVEEVRQGLAADWRKVQAHDAARPGLALTGGGRVALRVGEAEARWLGEGWAEPETWAGDTKVRWAIDRRSELWLPTADTGSGALRLRMAPRPGSKQTVTPIVEGKALETRALAEGMSEEEWRLEPGLGKDGLLRVVLEFGRSRAPYQDDRRNFDTRMLCAAMERVELGPLQDKGKGIWGVGGLTPQPPLHGMERGE